MFDYTADLNRGRDLGLYRTVTGATLLGQFWLSDDWSLSTITGWRQFDSHEEFDGDGTQLALIETAEIAKGDQLSQEVRFNYDGGGAFRGFVGGSWFKESGSQRVPITTDERSLYEDLRDHRIRPSLRLEQEYIGFGQLEEALKLIHARDHSRRLGG